MLRMDLRLTAEHELLRRNVREFAEGEIRPHVMAWDEAQAFPPSLLSKLAALGLTGIQVPEAYGGAGMSAIEYCICIEELARVDPSIALSVAAHNGLAVAHLKMFASETLKRRYLVPLAKGEQLGAWGLTEAGAGSDAGGVQTSARRERVCRREGDAGLQLREERDRIQVSNARLEDENKKLAEQIRRLRTDKEEVERIAREEMMLVGKGEIVYQFDK